MRRHRDGAADGLVGDVANVLHGQAMVGELLAEPGDRYSSLGGHRGSPRVDVEDLGKAIELDQAPIRACDVRERVTGADHLDAFS